MNDAHTPGPWVWDGDSLWHMDAVYMPYEKSDPHLFTGITRDPNLIHSPILQANSRLIASCPKLRSQNIRMIEELRQISQLIDADCIHSCNIDFIVKVVLRIGKIANDSLRKFEVGQ